MLNNSTTFFARLLANENITVQVNNSAKTASFSPRKRILILPPFADDDSPTTNLFILHEIAHALWTPNKVWERGVNELSRKYRGGKGVINILEDIRIENKIRAKYLGSWSSFSKGYKELIKRDFFQIKGKNLKKIGFLNRLNIGSKCNPFEHLIDFTKDEEYFYEKALNAKSLKVILGIAEELLEFLKKKEKKKSQPEPEDSEQDDDDGEEPSEVEEDLNDEEEDESNESSDDDDEDDTNEKENESSDECHDESDESSDEEQDKENGDSLEKPEDEEELEESHDSSNDLDDSTESEDEFDDFDASTLENLEKNLQESSLEKTEGTLSITHDANALTENDIFRFSQNYAPSHRRSRAFRFIPQYENSSAPLLNETILKENEKENARLVSKFNSVRSAWATANSHNRRTGKIDTERLNSYKTHEDIFKRKKITPRMQSHGMIFYIDFSASMKHIIKETLDIVSQITLFCNSAKIPFVVYGFTSCKNPKRNVQGTQMEYLERIKICESTSAMTTKQIKKVFLSIPQKIKMVLHGTPLQQAALDLFSIHEEFAQKNPTISKISTVIISDGEGSPNYNFNHYEKVQTYVGKKQHQITFSPNNTMASEIIEQYEQLTNSPTFCFYLHGFGERECTDEAKSYQSSRASFRKTTIDTMSNSPEQMNDILVAEKKHGFTKFFMVPLKVIMHDKRQFVKTLADEFITKIA